MDTVLQPLLAEHLKNRLKLAQDKNLELATELQDDEALRVLSDCETQFNRLFPEAMSGMPPLAEVIEGSSRLIHRLEQCQGQLGKKAKTGASPGAQELREKTRKSVEEAKDFLHYCMEQEEEVCGNGKRDDEELRRIRHDMKQAIKSNQIYDSEHLLKNLNHWSCTFEKIHADKKFISPDLAQDFFGKLQTDICRMQIDVQNRQEQQYVFVNLLKIRQAMFSLQTALLSRVILGQPLAARA